MCSNSSRAAGVRLSSAKHIRNLWKPASQGGNLLSHTIGKSFRRTSDADSAWWLSARRTCGFGLRRQLLDEDHPIKGILRRGEKKSIQTDRVLLIPVPPEEVAVVHRIYSLFLEGGMPERVIASGSIGKVSATMSTGHGPVAPSTRF